MSTVRSFQPMLNEFLHNNLLKNELIKRNYFVQEVERVDTWKGGKIPVSFKGGVASSIKMGGLTAANDVSEAEYVRGEIQDYKEMWTTMIFNHRDIMDHSGRVNEDSFLATAMETIEDTMDMMKMTLSIQIATGAVYSKFMADGTAGGVIEVSRVDRFERNQKIIVQDDNTAAATYYVIAIDVNAGAGGFGTITVSATRGGAAADVSVYTAAQNARIYTDGANTTSFLSLKDALLSVANGGSATIHGQSKVTYPYLQAINISGAAINATNVLDKIFDGFSTVRQKARKGKIDRAIVSYKHFGSILKIVENKTNGAANWSIDKAGRKASIYGWDEIAITAVDGSSLKIVALQEMDDDVIFLLDMKSFKFMSNGFFKKRKSPEGLEYFEVRNTTGYQYLVDICLFGELMVHKPGNNGIIHSIPNY